MAATAPSTTPPVALNPALYLSPEMVSELAMGMDPPYAIAARYGLEQAEFDILQAQTWFGAEVARKRMEYADGGTLFEIKARLMAEEMYTDLFKLAKADELAHAMRVEVAKQLRDIGGLGVKGVAAGETAPRFAINIQVNGVDQNVAQRTRLDLAPTAPVVTMVIPFDQPLPPKPEGLRVPDFDIRAQRSPLVGSPAAVQAALAPQTEPR